MELIHRWTITTSRSVSCSPSEHHWMQVALPQQAFRHRFILYNMLSTAALEIVASSRDGISAAPYRRAALEYFNKSSALMRCELSKGQREDNVHLLFLNATFAVYNHLAIAQLITADGEARGQTPSAVKRGCLLFDMCLGAAYMLQPNPATLDTHLDYLPSLRLQWSGLSLDDLRSDDRLGIRFLEQIRSAVFNGDAGESAHTILDSATYDAVIARLRLCYSHDLHRVAQGFCMSFPKYSGYGVRSAAELNDPLAHLLLMYWGVLLYRLANDVWWIGTLGREMVQEMSEGVLQSPLAKVHQAVEAVAWTVSQVTHVSV